MANNLISDLYPAGSALFSNSESFMTDLSEEDESMITGGRRFRSRTRRRSRRSRRSR